MDEAVRRMRMLPARALGSADSRAIAGCLPIIIQMPVFFAFNWVLLESVEMRQALFLGGIQDLSSKDPLFVLPLIITGAMLVQTKLNPTPPEPIFGQGDTILVGVISVTLAFFPAGLVLYWATNTVLSIAQQWSINRRVEAEAKKEWTGVGEAQKLSHRSAIDK